MTEIADLQNRRLAEQERIRYLLNSVRAEEEAKLIDDLTAGMIETNSGLKYKISKKTFYDLDMDIYIINSDWRYC